MAPFINIIITKNHKAYSLWIYIHTLLQEKKKYRRVVTSGLEQWLPLRREAREGKKGRALVASITFYYFE